MENTNITELTHLELNPSAMYYKNMGRNLQKKFYLPQVT